MNVEVSGLPRRGVKPARAWRLGLIALLLAAPVFAELPIPPAPTRWVTDTANFLSAPARQRLDARLEAYERATGHQLVVWIGPSLEGGSLEDWAARTFEKWGVGRKGKDDGAALFVFSQDRKLRIEVGYGLEHIITDARAAQIIRDVAVPRLRAGDPDGAVLGTMDVLMNTIEPDGQPALAPHVRQKTRGGPVGIGTVLLWAVLGIGFLILLVTHPQLAMFFLYSLVSGGRGGGFGGRGGGGFSGGGGRSGGGGASGSW